MKKIWFAIKMVFFLPVMVGFGIVMGFAGSIMMWLYHWMNIMKDEPGNVFFDGVIKPEMELECQCNDCTNGRHGY